MISNLTCIFLGGMNHTLAKEKKEYYSTENYNTIRIEKTTKREENSECEI